MHVGRSGLCVARADAVRGLHTAKRPLQPDFAVRFGVGRKGLVRC